MEYVGIVVAAATIVLMLLAASGDLASSLRAGVQRQVDSILSDSGPGEGGGDRAAGDEPGRGSKARGDGAGDARGSRGGGSDGDGLSAGDVASSGVKAADELSWFKDARATVGDLADGDFAGAAGHAALALPVGKIAKGGKVLGKLVGIGGKKGPKPPKRGRREDCPTSFVASTPVLLADGRWRAIEHVGPGDRVLARSPTRIRAGPARVVEHRQSCGVKELVRLTVAGRDLSVTADHPFRVAQPVRWVAAGRLRLGQRLLTPNGVATVQAARRYRARTTVHTLSVTAPHTYHAGPAAVLVHNARPCPTPAGVGRDATTWRGLRTSGTAKLTRKLEGKLGPKPPGTATHHLVPTGEYTRRAARGPLQEAQGRLQQLGIGPDEAANGAFLDAAAHRRIHTDRYFQALGEELRAVEAVPVAQRKARAEEILGDVRERVIKGDFPH